MNRHYHKLISFLLIVGSISFSKNVPKRLTPGDTILFVAPSGSLDKTRMALVKQRLEERGYITIQAEDIFREHGYLGGADARRVEELMAAWTNPQVKAIFPGTGGYGTTRILDLLDYEMIKENPKILVGFSDITGLHLAIMLFGMARTILARVLPAGHISAK